MIILIEDFILTVKKETTRERVLKSACLIFAEKGFRETTIMDICDHAGANIASVNYYFDGKMDLYSEVWQYAVSMASSQYPLDTLGEDASAEDCLYNYAQAMLSRIFCEEDGGLFAKLLYHEVASPILTIEQIFREALFPQYKCIENVMKEKLNLNLSKQQMLWCRQSIISQCAFYNFSRTLREHLMGKSVMSSEEIKEAARHIARFSLGGLKAVLEERDE